MRRRYFLTGEVVKDAIWSANDGIITTFAVVAGATGASLPASIVLILGMANLFADGFSMAASNYLGTKSELEYVGDQHSHGLRLRKAAAVTFVSFIVAGFFPLIPFVFGLPASFPLSFVSTAISLLIVGVIRGYIVKKHIIVSALEMLAVGGAAALIAYSMGHLIRSLLSGFVL